MKKYYVILGLLITFTSCKKEDIKPKQTQPTAQCNCGIFVEKTITSQTQYGWAG